MAHDPRGRGDGEGSGGALDLGTDPRVRRLPPPPSARLQAIAAGIAAVAILVPAAVVRFGPKRLAPYQVLVAIPGRVIPAAELPPVEPLAIRDLSPDAARAFNATVPFSTDPNPAARPFRPAGAADDLARATDCLAAAAYYEAGDDPAGERAVAQVVLNRVRHPAFPKTVCGVVFQGSERTTGCQFTFACDGALVRYVPTPDQWARARALATAALAGRVEPAVGHATHYHTEWVVPYWQASLDKIVAVHTQLFYRWSGWWGTPPAFDRRAEASEPGIAALARLSDAHRLATTALPDLAPANWADDPLVDPMAPPALAGAAAAPAGPILATLPAGLATARWPEFASQSCGGRDRCTVMAWTDRARIPATLPLDPAQVATMAFSFVRDRALGPDRPLWNCRETPRPDPRQCMKRQLLLAVPAVPDTSDATATSSPAAELPGVRRKGSAEPVTHTGDHPEASYSKPATQGAPSPRP